MRLITPLAFATSWLAACLSTCSLLGEEARVQPAAAYSAGWPSYRGPRDDYSALDDGIALVSDPARATLLWKSEAVMPRAKAWSSTDRGSGAAGHPGGGGCSPIVAFGCVYQFYTQPSGDIWYDVPRGRSFARDLFRVEGDDVIHCVDLATGKTRWIRTFVRRSLNAQSMKSSIPDNNSPCIVGDTLVFLGPSWRLYGIDAHSGEWRWERPASPRSDERELMKLNSLLTRSRTISGHNLGLAYLQPVGDETVLLNDQSGSIHAINAADGTTRWSVGGGKNGPHVSRWHQPAIWRHGDMTLLLLSTTAGVHCLDANDGTEQWRIAGVRPHGHLVVIGDHLIGLGGMLPGKAGPELLGHRGGAIGYPICWQLHEDEATELWRRDDMTTDCSKWAFRLNDQSVGILHWTFAGENRKQLKALDLCVLDLATGKDCVKPISALGLISGTRNGYGLATNGSVIFEHDMSHASHHFFSVQPLAKDASFSALWDPPHPTTTAYDSYMMKPMIAGRRVMRGALGLVCYDWRQDPVKDELFAAPDLPDWTGELPENYRDLAHPFQSRRDAAAAKAPWSDVAADAIDVLLTHGDRTIYESLSTALVRWRENAGPVSTRLSQRIAELVQSGQGDSAAALARGLQAVDPTSAKQLASSLTPHVSAEQPTVARAACEAIGRLGPGLPETAVAALVTALERDDVAAQYAARTLTRSDTTEDEALTALIAGIQSSDSRKSVACSQSLRALIARGQRKGDLSKRLVELLPPTTTEMAPLARLGLARVAEQLGSPGRDYLIALGEASDSKSIVVALAFNFPDDPQAAGFIEKTLASLEGNQQQRLHAELNRAREKIGGDLPQLRLPEALRY